MKELWIALRYGRWSCGWGQWPGKPQFAFVRVWYDCQRNALHIGPLWIECDTEAPNAKVSEGENGR